jgi:hypothetical protein
LFSISTSGNVASELPSRLFVDPFLIRLFPPNFNPNESVNRNIFIEKYDANSNLVKCWLDGHDMTNALQDALWHPIFDDVWEGSPRTQDQQSSWSPSCYIFGENQEKGCTHDHWKHGVEDGEVKISEFTHCGIPRIWLAETSKEQQKFAEQD